MRVILALLLAWVAPQAVMAADACDSLIPAALKTQLLRAYPGYRLPRELDNLPEDIKYAREHAGTACLGIATADFNGDGRSDFLVALTSPDGQGALVVVALTRGQAWRLYKLDALKDGRSRLYVSDEPPGTYDDVGDYDGPREEGAVEHLKCPNAVAVFGTTEASAVAYCFLNGHWKHAWISD